MIFRDFSRVYPHAQRSAVLSEAGIDFFTAGLENSEVKYRFDSGTVMVRDKEAESKFRILPQEEQIRTGYTDVQLSNSAVITHTPAVPETTTTTVVPASETDLIPSAGDGSDLSDAATVVDIGLDASQITATTGTLNFYLVGQGGVGFPDSLGGPVDFSINTADFNALTGTITTSTTSFSAGETVSVTYNDGTNDYTIHIGKDNSGNILVGVLDSSDTLTDAIGGFPVIKMVVPETTTTTTTPGTAAIDLLVDTGVPIPTSPGSLKFWLIDNVNDPIPDRDADFTTTRDIVNDLTTDASLVAGATASVVANAPDNSRLAFSKNGVVFAYLTKIGTDFAVILPTNDSNKYLRIIHNDQNLPVYVTRQTTTGDLNLRNSEFMKPSTGASDEEVLGFLWGTNNDWIRELPKIQDFTIPSYPTGEDPTTNYEIDIPRYRPETMGVYQKDSSGALTLLESFAPEATKPSTKTVLVGGMDAVPAVDPTPAEYDGTVEVKLYRRRSNGTSVANTPAPNFDIQYVLGTGPTDLARDTLSGRGYNSGGTIEAGRGAAIGSLSGTTNQTSASLLANTQQDLNFGLDELEFGTVQFWAINNSTDPTPTTDPDITTTVADITGLLRNAEVNAGATQLIGNNRSLSATVGDGILYVALLPSGDLTAMYTGTGSFYLRTRYLSKGTGDGNWYQDYRGERYSRTGGYNAANHNIYEATATYTITDSTTGAGTLSDFTVAELTAGEITAYDVIYAGAGDGEGDDINQRSGSLSNFDNYTFTAGTPGSPMIPAVPGTPTEVDIISTPITGGTAKLFQRVNDGASPTTAPTAATYNLVSDELSLTGGAGWSQNFDNIYRDYVAGTHDIHVIEIPFTVDSDGAATVSSIGAAAKLDEPDEVLEQSNRFLTPPGITRTDGSKTVYVIPSTDVTWEIVDGKLILVTVDDVGFDGDAHFSGGEEVRIAYQEEVTDERNDQLNYYHSQQSNNKIEQAKRWKINGIETLQFTYIDKDSKSRLALTNFDPSVGWQLNDKIKPGKEGRITKAQDSDSNLVKGAHVTKVPTPDFPYLTIQL